MRRLIRVAYLSASAKQARPMIAALQGTGASIVSLKGGPVPKRCRRMICMDCHGATLDWYMVRDDLWRELVGDKYCGYLCYECLEYRLGRGMTSDDLSDPTVNLPDLLRRPLFIREPLLMVPELLIPRSRRELLVNYLHAHGYA